MLSKRSFLRSRDYAFAGIKVPAVLIRIQSTGTTSITMRGTLGSELVCDPGNGGETQIKTLQGVATDVVWEFSNSGSTVARITGSIKEISYFLALGQGLNGDISEILRSMDPAKLTYLRSDWSTLCGDISELSRFVNLTSLLVQNNDMHGDISEILGLTSLSSLYAKMNRFSFSGGIFPAWTGGTFDLSSCLLSSAEVDSILAGMASGGVHDCAVKLGDFNFPRTTSSDSDVTTLESANVTLTVNDPVEQPDDPNIPGDSIVIEGDSISTSIGWPAYLDNDICTGGTITNFAESGNQTAQMIIQYPQSCSVYGAHEGYNGYFIFMGGTNDLNQNRTASFIIENIEIIISSARSDYDVIAVFHVLPSTSFDIIKEQRREYVNCAINNMVISGLIDVVVEVPASMIDPSDADYYTDGTHPTTLGKQILASALEASLGWI